MVSVDQRTLLGLADQLIDVLFFQLFFSGRLGR
jgi:hypothetical protein